MRVDLDLIQWEVIKLGGLVVVTLIVLIHIVKLAREAIAEIKKPFDRRPRQKQSQPPPSLPPPSL
jgi:hypothetical protein